MNVRFSVDGTPVDPNCACPVCADMARRGIPIVTVGPDGELLEPALPAEPPAMIAIAVRGTLSTWPELPPEPQTIEVPVGCVVQDALEFLRYRNFDLLTGFAPNALSARMAGEPCEPLRVVRPGDELIVTGSRDDEWAEFATCFSPPP